VRCRRIEHAHVGRIDDRCGDDAIGVGRVETFQQQQVVDLHVFQRAEEAVPVRGDADIAGLADLRRARDPARAAIEVLLRSAVEHRHRKLHRGNTQYRQWHSCCARRFAVALDTLERPRRHVNSTEAIRRRGRRAHCVAPGRIECGDSLISPVCVPPLRACVRRHQ
jgi:hypothetical protein